MKKQSRRDFLKVVGLAGAGVLGCGSRAGGATPPGFLALHPTWAGRVEEIEAQIPAILPLYEQARTEQAARPRPPPVRMRPGLN